MEPYTELELNQMRYAFNMIEAAYISMGKDCILPETQEHRRLNKKLVDELAKEKPDHEVIYYLLNAINTIQNGKQQTTTAFPPEEKPNSSKTYSIKRWFKKICKTRK